MTSSPPPAGSRSSPPFPAPLRGIRILELAQNLAGPYASQILADLGAEVVKVEHPDGGDPAREWGPPFVGGDGGIFAFANRAKRSAALDLRVEADRKVFAKLLGDADVLIEALRPGALERLGFGPDAAAAANPELLYASVLAYGEEGPLRDLPGYDPLMQAHGGVLSTTGPVDGPPVRVGTSIVDVATGMWLATSILARLRERDRTRKGGRITVSLFDSALAWSGYHLLGFLSEGAVPRPMGTELAMIAPYGAFPTADGPLMIAAGNDGLFRKLCEALGLDELSDRPGFRTNAERVRNRAALNPLVAERTALHTKASLLTTLRQAGVPVAPILTIPEVATDPQTTASGMLVPEGETSPVPAVALPLRWDGCRPPTGRRPPTLGEHTAEVRHPDFAWEPMD